MSGSLSDALPLAATELILADLVGFASVSQTDNLDLMAYIAATLEAAGASVLVQESPAGDRANVFATIGPMRDGGIVLSGHTDVVPAEELDWDDDPFILRPDNDRLYGRGTCDMKGFIAACLAMAPRFAAVPLNRPIHFAFTYDEEVGCFGARQLVEELQRFAVRPALAIVGEPTEMGMIEGHKGCFEYTTVFEGREGHASEPEKGVNAIEYAARYITRMMELARELQLTAPVNNRFEPPYSTVQVGRIEGGSARNVIAGHCAVEWEIRPVRAADADRVKTELDRFAHEDLLPAMRHQFADAAIIRHTVGEVEGLEPVPHNQACALVAELTGQSQCDVVSFGTEAGLFQSLGMSVVVCGPGSIAQAHKANEYVSRGQLLACLNLLEGLIGKLCA